MQEPWLSADFPVVQLKKLIFEVLIQDDIQMGRCTVYLF